MQLTVVASTIVPYDTCGSTCSTNRLLNLFMQTSMFWSIHKIYIFISLKNPMVYNIIGAVVESHYDFTIVYVAM